MGNQLHIGQQVFPINVAKGGYDEIPTVQRIDDFGAAVYNAGGMWL